MLFDRFIVVDWSARNAPSPAKPHKDAIWLAEGKAASDRTTVKYFRTRQACYQYLIKRLHTCVKAKERVFVGFDVSYAYPCGTAKAIGLKTKPRWKAIWELLYRLVSDDEKNNNNRYVVGGELNRRIGAALGPFWGTTSYQSGIFLGPKKDFQYPVVTRKAELAEKRIVETRHKGMQPAWKLAYTGSVGSQALMGIPYLYRLRFEDKLLRNHSLVWPYESGFTTDPLTPTDDLILHAEIWPSLADRPKKDPIPDREQVKAMITWLRRHQRADTLAALFDTPEGLSNGEVKACVKEEGWILGA